MISFEPLRRMLKEKRISTYYLRNKCGINNIDSKTIQRLMSDESVSTNTLNSLCNILGCDISEIIEFVPDDLEHAVPLSTELMPGALDCENEFISDNRHNELY